MMIFKRKKKNVRSVIKNNKDYYKGKGVYFYSTDIDLIDTPFCPSINKNTALVGNFAGYFGTMINHKLNFDCETALYENILFKKIDKNKKIEVITTDKATIDYMNDIKALLKEGQTSEKKKMIDRNFVIYGKPIEDKGTKESNKEILDYLTNLINMYCMKVDEILANPPFAIGAKIVQSILNVSSNHTNIVVLGPISMYWYYYNYMYIRSHQNVKNIFAEVDIADNLSIVKLSKYKDERADKNQIEMETYNQKFIDFYKSNRLMNLRYAFRRCDNAKVEDFDFDRDYVDSNRLVGIDNGFMNGGDSQGYIWNVSKQKIIRNSGLSVISFEIAKAKDNFTTWAYSDVRNGLANKILWGLNKVTVSSSCSIAIPQIDWEIIDTHPLWDIDYDEAVLDVMGLKWNENKDGVEKKSDYYKYNYDTKEWYLTKK